MSFDLFAQQQQILDRLAAAATAAGIAVAGTFDIVDLTDQGAETTGAQIVFSGFAPEGQVAGSARHNVQWSFDLYVDTSRASADQKAAAAQLFNAALAALVGWEIAAGRQVRTAQGQESGWDGRVLRISFGFIVPVFLAG